jgi:hypothetical protein
VMVKIMYTKIRNKKILNANKIIEIQKPCRAAALHAWCSCVHARCTSSSSSSSSDTNTITTLHLLLLLLLVLLLYTAASYMQ